jgi:AraC family transcriptional regulator of adaptative response / DNA-3-methyladenine glycosylase II
MEHVEERREVTLDFKPPFRWEAIAGFLAARAIASVESFEGVQYRRGNVVITAGPASLRMLGGSADDARRARMMFDLDADPIAIDAHLRRDPLLRPLLKRRPAPRVPGGWEPLEIAVRAIVGQQISVARATVIMNKLFEGGRFNESALGGMPRVRIEAIGNMVEVWPRFAPGASLDESIDRLTALKGVGPWTAHYIAMRALRYPDAFPHSDLGLRKAAAALGIDDLLARAERWRPYRAYAAITLWESLA